MPTISADGLTYTFQIRNDYAFSPPATGVVTAASMKYTFERTLAPSMVSPGAQFYMNIVGAAEYNQGQAQHISGIVASGDTLTITLIQPQGEFLTLLAMPFLCAVPTSLPFTEVQAPVPSAGPYYIAEHTPNVSLVALRNPNYQDLARRAGIRSSTPTVTRSRRFVSSWSLGRRTIPAIWPRPIRRSSTSSTARAAQRRRRGTSNGLRIPSPARSTCR